MTVEGWQLATAALGILGAGGTAARLYFSGLASRIGEVRREAVEGLAAQEKRLRDAEQTDAGYKQQLSDMARRLDDDARRVATASGQLSAEVAALSRNVTGLMVAFGKVEERLDIKREIQGLVGRRDSDKNGEHER